MDHRLPISRLKDAVLDGNLEEATKLINSFGLPFSEGYYLLVAALRTRHAAVAKLLLTSGSKVNSSKTKNDVGHNTPLHLAVGNGYIEIVKMILNKGANIDAKNRFGKTPLHYAIDTQKVEVVDLLLKHGTNVNVGDNDGITPLHLAVMLNCAQIVEHLLNYGAKINRVFAKTILGLTLKKGCTPLHFSVRRGNERLSKLLLSRGANVNCKDEDSITPLHIAAREGHKCIAEDLLNHGASIYSLTLMERYTPLHFASRQGNEDIVKLFLNRGADVNANTTGHLTPLHIATEKEHKIVMKLLLQGGAKVDNQDEDGKTVLYVAVKTGNLAIVKDVLKHCPDINIQGNRRSLKIAVHDPRENYKKIVEALLKYGLTVDPQEANNPAPLLHAAVKKGYFKIVEDLLSHGANVNILNEGFIPLHSAVQNEQVEPVNFFIRYEVLKTPIFYAIQNADLKMTKLLLMNGANVKDNPELLSIAVEKEFIEIIKALLQHNIDINSSDEYGCTALHATVLSRNDSGRIRRFFNVNHDYIKNKIAKVLLSKGANVNSRSKYGVTPLHGATQKEYAKVVNTLLKYNANVNSAELENGITPLHLSAKSGNKEITTMLLKKGANVNVKQKDGMTALHKAIQYGNKEVVKVLLKYGANVNSKIKNSTTPLHLVAWKEDWEIIKTILKFSADVDSRDELGRTPLHIACRVENLEVVKILLEYGSDMNITDKNNRTPLDYVTVSKPGDAYNIVEKGISDFFKRHIVKMKTAKLYVNEKNLCSISKSYELCDFKCHCEKEIAIMKSETINNTNISFYDILTKPTSSLTIYMRNENIVQVLKSDNYKKKIPMYASLIKGNFRKGMERKELIEQGNTIFSKLFPELPHDAKLTDCTEQIFSYLSIEDFTNLIEACKPLWQQ